MITLAEFVRATPLFLIAHRGASGVAPENTIAAISKAVESGIAMIEIDVQSTSDQQLIVFHDPVLGRTTNGHGTVNETSLAAIRDLDAGSWFGEQYAHEQVPLLHEALDVIQGHAYLNIEIKPRIENPRALEQAFVLHEQIVRRGLLPYTVFSSFDHGLLLALKQRDAIVHACALNVPGDDRLPSHILAECSADAFGCSIEELTDQRAADCRRHTIPWGAYTVNTQEQIDVVRSFGLNAVVTNNTDLRI